MPFYVGPGSSLRQLAFGGYYRWTEQITSRDKAASALRETLQNPGNFETAGKVEHCWKGYVGGVSHRKSRAVSPLRHIR